MIRQIYSKSLLSGPHSLSASRFARIAVSKRFATASASPEAKEEAKHAGEVEVHTVDPTTAPRLGRGTIWFDNVLPLRLRSWDLRYLVISPREEKLEEYAKKELIPPDLPGQLTVTQVKPSPKEGGMLLTFDYSGDPDEAAERINDYVRHKQLRPWFSVYHNIRALPVKGTPFVEDIIRRNPSHWLHVKYLGNPMSVEALYNLFRPYGRIAEITPEDKGASIIFTRIRSATSARNCLNGLTVGDTKLELTYEMPKSHRKWIEWFNAHTRMALLFAGAVFAFFSLVVFEPVRQMFIANKVSKRFTWEEISKWLEAHWIPVHKIFRNRFGWKKPNAATPLDLKAAGLEEVAMETERIIKLIKASAPETLIFLIGPKGSGKSQIVDQVLENSRFDLVINCDVLQAQPHDHLILGQLAKSVGYWPQFSSLRKVAGMVDSLILAATGTNAGLSTTPQQDFKGILDSVSGSFKNFIADQEEANKKAQAKAEANGLAFEPKPIEYPVVVVEAFVARDRKGKPWVYEELASWAAQLVENKVAHVILCSRNAAAVKLGAKVMPTKTFEISVLHDASEERALQYLSSQLGQDVVRQHYDIVRQIVSGIGGRLNDLDAFVQRVKAATAVKGEFNETVDITEDLLWQSYQEMILKTISECRKAGFGDVGDNLAWTPTQYWAIVKALSDKDEVPYDKVRAMGVFGSDAPLLAMESEDLISIEMEKGRPYMIRVARPITKSAFRAMVHDDKRFAGYMEAQSLKELIAKEQSTKILPAEEEMTQLEKILGSGTSGGGLRKSLSWDAREKLEKRVEFLAQTIGSSQAKISDWASKQKEFEAQMVA